VAHAITPVLVTASPLAAASTLCDLLRDYQATLRAEEGAGVATVEVVPLDNYRRGTVIYRVIQASRTVADRFPNARLYLITEDGERWELPPSPL